MHQLDEVIGGANCYILNITFHENKVEVSKEPTCFCKGKIDITLLNVNMEYKGEKITLHVTKEELDDMLREKSLTEQFYHSIGPEIREIIGKDTSLCMNCKGKKIKWSLSERKEYALKESICSDFEEFLKINVGHFLSCEQAVDSFCEKNPNISTYIRNLYSETSRFKNPIQSIFDIALADFVDSFIFKEMHNHPEINQEYLKKIFYEKYPSSYIRNIFDMKLSFFNTFASN